MPDVKRAVAVDQRMRSELAASLEHIRTKIREQSNDDGLIQLSNRLDPILNLLRSNHRVSPALFGYYYQLVFAILNENNKTAEILNSLLKFGEPRHETSILDLSEIGLGNADLVSLYQDCLDTDINVTYGFVPPDLEDSQRMQQSIEQAFKLMQKVLPELLAEIQALIVEILLAAAPKSPGAPQFGGASSYQLWGAMVLNVDGEKSDVEMMEALAHETAHSLLFGLTIQEPLVNNSDDLRFQSPLRSDPRPMDGIYHATFVSARMHYAMHEAFKSSLLDDQQKEECEQYMAASRKAFYDGYDAVTDNAELSIDGKLILQNAYNYMQAVV